MFRLFDCLILIKTKIKKQKRVKVKSKFQRIHEFNPSLKGNTLNTDFYFKSNNMTMVVRKT